MAWSGLASNQMVSYTDAQGGGFALQPGQSPVTSNQCMTKANAIAKYVLNPTPLAPYASNQLIPKSAWQPGSLVCWKLSVYNNNEFVGATGYYLDCCTGEETYIELSPCCDQESSTMICSRTRNPYNTSTYLQWEDYFVQDCLPCPPQ